MRSLMIRVAVTVLLSTSGFIVSSSLIHASPHDVELKPELFAEKPVYSPFAGRDYPDQVLFGDSHFHTNVSFDAGLVGTRLTVYEGFRFARGEKVISNTGQPVQLIRPLDFLVVTDHAEFMGLAPMLQNSDPLLLADPWGQHMYKLFNSGQEGRMQAFGELIEIGTVTMKNPFSSDTAAINIWQNFIEVADTYNEPGRFTAMTGYEWTSTPKGDNLHRCVILADGADKTSQTHPFSVFDSQDPEDLWSYLELYEEKTGGRAMAIPHNGNLSNGLMFLPKTFKGEDFTREYAERRIRWEPLYEMTQIKGDEEAHPFLSTDDEFADFENWDVSNLSGTAAKEDWMLHKSMQGRSLKLAWNWRKRWVSILTNSA